MRLYVEPMDAVVVEVGADGRIRYGDGDARIAGVPDAEWQAPSLQERRAIIYAARKEVEALTELLEVLDPTPPGS